MPATAAELQADIDVLDTAIRTGARVVRFQDRTTEYRSIAEMLVARNAAQTQLDLLNNIVRVRQTRMYTNKGWDD